jgi:hypothetical protein
MTRKESKQRRAAAGNPALVHGHHDLIECPVTLLLDKGENLFDIVIEPRPAAPEGLGLACPFVAPRLVPSHCRADANAEAFCRLMPARSLVHCLNNTGTQIQ